MHLVPDDAYGRWKGRKGSLGWRHLAQPASLCRPSFLSFRSPSFNLLTEAEKERKNGMGEERKREGEVRTNEQIGSGFTPLRERPTEGDYGLTILHCVTICPSSLRRQGCPYLRRRERTRTAVSEEFVPAWAVDIPRPICCPVLRE